jgi:ketosteroid isomerase-like protein
MGDAVDVNLARTRRMYSLWNEGGVDALAEHVVAADVVYHDIPELPDTGVFRGVDAVAARMSELVDMGGTLRFDVLSLEGRGDHVLAAVLINSKFPRTGEPVTTPVYQVVRYQADRVCELRAYLDADQARREYERLTPPPAD